MASKTRVLTIGQVADRTGLSISAIRFYEDKGLVLPIRNTGRQRRFRASDIRRLSFVMISQQLGLPISDIRKQLSQLPNKRTHTRKDWEKISAGFRKAIQDRIEVAIRMRDRLDGCIGCGCLSLNDCELYNNGDRLAAQGVGPKHVLSK